MRARSSDSRIAIELFIVTAPVHHAPVIANAHYAGHPPVVVGGCTPSWCMIVGTTALKTGAAAVPPKWLKVAARRLVDGDQGGHRGLLGGEEADERRVVGRVLALLAVLAVDDLTPVPVLPAIVMPST